VFSKKHRLLDDVSYVDYCKLRNAVFCVSGINTGIVDSARRTALDIVRDLKTKKALEIAKLIAGNFRHVTNWRRAAMM